jgi:RNA-directed DNA polymerase
MLNEAIAPKWVKDRLTQCLNAAVNLNFSDQGTPQAGVPTFSKYSSKWHELHTSVTYADHMIFIFKPADDPDKINQ